MEEQFVPNELAVKLKDLGFDEQCFGYFRRNFHSGVELIYSSHQLIDRDDFCQFESQQECINYGSDREGISLCLAPLWQQAFDWFRVQYSLDGTITSWKRSGGIEFLFSIEKIGSPSIYRNSFSTYEEARLECLKKLIDLTT